MGRCDLSSSLLIDCQKERLKPHQARNRLPPHRLTEIRGFGPNRTPPYRSQNRRRLAEEQKHMAGTVSMIGLRTEELSWVRLVVNLLRHPDPAVPELVRQALLYISHSANTVHQPPTETRQA